MDEVDKFLTLNYITMKPTQKMIEWFDKDFNIMPENMDDLEYNFWEVTQQKNFIDEFDAEIMDLSHIDKLILFVEAKYGV